MYYLYGQDVFGAREEIGKLSREQNLPIRWIDREELDKKPLEQWLDEAAGGLFGQELVVVRDSSEWSKVQQDTVLVAAKERAQTDWIVWDRAAPDKRSKLFKFLKQYGREFPVWQSEKLVTWLQSVVSIERPAAEELIRRVGADRWRLKHESERLVLRYDPITMAAVKEEVEGIIGAGAIFPLLDALVAGNSSRAMREMQVQLAAGASEFYVISMLGYQLRVLLAVKSGQTDSLHPFVVQKSSPAARRFSFRQLEDFLTRVAATDFAIKQGKVDARTAVTMLVMTLTQQVKNTAS